MEETALLLEDKGFVRHAVQSTLGNPMPKTLRTGSIELDPGGSL